LKILKKWADPSGDRGDEIDAKTLYPGQLGKTITASFPYNILGNHLE